MATIYQIQEYADCTSAGSELPPLVRGYVRLPIPAGNHTAGHSTAAARVLRGVLSDMPIYSCVGACSHVHIGRTATSIQTPSNPSDRHDGRSGRSRKTFVGSDRTRQTEQIGQRIPEASEREQEVDAREVAFVCA